MASGTSVAPDNAARMRSWRIPGVPSGSAVVLVAVRGQNAPVCGRVLLRERGDAQPQAVGPFGRPGRVGLVVGGQTGGHAG
jgi:hypothetical protein